MGGHWGPRQGPAAGPGVPPAYSTQPGPGYPNPQSLKTDKTTSRQNCVCLAKHINSLKNISQKPVLLGTFFHV